MVLRDSTQLYGDSVTSYYIIVHSQTTLLLSPTSSLFLNYPHLHPPPVLFSSFYTHML